MPVSCGTNPLNHADLLFSLVPDLAAAGLNILDMLNRSRGNVAVTLIDIDRRCSQDTVEQLRSIDGVLSVRCLGTRERAD